MGYARGAADFELLFFPQQLQEMNMYNTFPERKKGKDKQTRYQAARV